MALHSPNQSDARKNGDDEIICWYCGSGFESHDKLDTHKILEHDKDPV